MITIGLSIPSTSFLLEGSTATITREIEGGEEVVSVNTPVVVSCQKGVAEQRIPNMRGIMTARSKPLQVLEATENDAATRAAKFVKPAAKSAVKLVDSVDELVHLLHNEAKAI